MGEMVEFPSNGSSVQGYVAAPEGGGPGLVVIQEWWGLVDHIKDVCERFAAEGFVALAPDLYHGEHTTEPDEAGKLMMALSIDRAAQDLSGAVDHLKGRDDVRGDAVATLGFCMGGGLAMYLGTLRPADVRAVVAFYGVIPWEAAQPDWSRLSGSLLLGHYGSDDAFLSVDQVRELEGTIRQAGADVEFHLYEGCDHAFFNDTRPEVYREDAANRAWERTIEFLKAALD